MKIDPQEMLHMKKVLVQMDTDKHPSLFDRIVGYDAGADEVLSYGQVTVDDVEGLIHGAFFTRGIPDLKNTAVWIGGADVVEGERLLSAARQTFFGPFKVSLMLDSNGCNTTAATAIAKLAFETELSGQQAVVVGPGPVGIRGAMLLLSEGCQVTLTTVPASLFGDDYQPELATNSLDNARKIAQDLDAGQKKSAQNGSLQVVASETQDDLEKILGEASIVVSAGPPGIQILPRSVWSSLPSAEFLLDFNLTEPLGLAGIKASDDFKEREGKRVLGPLAIGNPKMKVHKACIARLFESNDVTLDAEGVYNVAKHCLGGSS